MGLGVDEVGPAVVYFAAVAVGKRYPEGVVGQRYLGEVEPRLVESEGRSRCFGGLEDRSHGLVV